MYRFDFAGVSLFWIHLFCKIHPANCFSLKIHKHIPQSRIKSNKSGNPTSRILCCCQPAVIREVLLWLKKQYSAFFPDTGAFSHMFPLFLRFYRGSLRQNRRPDRLFSEYHPYTGSDPEKSGCAGRKMERYLPCYLDIV